MNKIFAFILLFSFVVMGPELKASADKPHCHVLSASEFANSKQGIVKYRDYHDYLYSRPVERKPEQSIKDILLLDQFSYSDLDKWIIFTDRMNYKGRSRGGFIYLPACSVLTQSEVPPVFEAPVEKVSLPEIKENRLNAAFGANFGQVNLKSDDSDNSKFTINFFKLTGSLVYKLKNELRAFAGLGINNYFHVNYTSNTTNKESYDINPYLEYFFGMREKIGSHIMGLQYDNLNYLLNQSHVSSVNLVPTRVDRISLRDRFSFNAKYFLMASVGVYFSYFSKATGYDLGLGGGLNLNKNSNIYLLYTSNKISKDDILNTAAIFNLGYGIQF